MKALANEDTLLPVQMFPRLPARATFVADTNFVSGTQKVFLILFRNILCPHSQQMFPSLRSPRNMGNYVSATMCTRLPGPWDLSIVLSWTITRGVKRENYHPLSWRIWASLIWIIGDDSWRFNGSAFYSWSVLKKDFIACVFCLEQFIPASCKFSSE